MKKLIILLIVMLIANSCVVSKGLHKENTFKNFETKHKINKELKQNFIY